MPTPTIASAPPPSTRSPAERLEWRTDSQASESSRKGTPYRLVEWQINPLNPYPCFGIVIPIQRNRSLPIPIHMLAMTHIDDEDLRVAVLTVQDTVVTNPYPKYVT